MNFPVALDKTKWDDFPWVIFLGLLLNTRLRIVCIPKEKITRALELIDKILLNRKNKATVYQIQQLCGYLNFLGRSILPGRAFTRRLYSLIGAQNSGQTTKLKRHHHIKVTQEAKLDLELWEYFLHHPSAYSRSFMDFSKTWKAHEVQFFTDSSKNRSLGCGGWCEKSWFTQQWVAEEITRFDPSIAYLELYAVMVGVKLWIHRFRNK